MAVAGYSTMQREILAGALREVYLDSPADRSFHLLALAKTIENNSDSEQELPTDLIAFRQQSQLDRTFSIGEHDAANGSTPYVWVTFGL